MLKIKGEKMKKFLGFILNLCLLILLAACGSQSDDKTTLQSENIQKNTKTETVKKESDMQIQIRTKDNQTIVFRLNQSPAAQSLYEQLPLSVNIEDYAGSEKIFYPPEKLDTRDTPLAEGPAGILAYYEPWGNVAFFYQACSRAAGLYALGEVVSGGEWIQKMHGEIQISRQTAEMAFTGQEEKGQSKKVTDLSDTKVQAAMQANAISLHQTSDLAIQKQGVSLVSLKLSEASDVNIGSKIQAFVQSTAKSAEQSSFQAQSSISIQSPIQTKRSTEETFLTTQNKSNVQAQFDTQSKADSVVPSAFVSTPLAKRSAPMFRIKMMIGQQTFSAKLYRNATTQALVQQFPLTIRMSELNRNEKFYYLSKNLPTQTQTPGSIRAGDLMLYGSDCLVLFYKNFSTSYSYTPLGYIENPTGLAAALGNNDVQVTFQ